MPKRSQWVFLGREWFDRVNGNTYHSVTVYKDCKIHGYVPTQYGYDMIKQTAMQYLIDNEITDKKYLYEFEKDNKGGVLVIVQKGLRKKDL